MEKANMAKSSTNATKAVVGNEASLILHDGNRDLNTRTVKVLAADDTGVAYSWSFRGSPRDDFAPWSAIHLLSVKHGPSADYPPKSWSKKFKKVKPGATGLKLVGKMCEMTVHDLGWDEGKSHTMIKGMVTVMDGQAVQFVYNRFGQVYTGVVPMSHLVNIEYREKKDTAPPGVSKKK